MVVLSIPADVHSRLTNLANIRTCCSSKFVVTDGSDPSLTFGFMHSAQGRMLLGLTDVSMSVWFMYMEVVGYVAAVIDKHNAVIHFYCNETVLALLVNLQVKHFRTWKKNDVIRVEGQLNCFWSDRGCIPSMIPVDRRDVVIENIGLGQHLMRPFQTKDKVLTC